MTKIIADAELRAKLNGQHQQVEVCDEAGETIGFYFSAAAYEDLIMEWVKLQYPLKELERRATQGGGRSLQEILTRLGAR